MSDVESANSRRGYFGRAPCVQASGARLEMPQGAGVIVTLSSTASLEWRHQMGGFNVACAGIEALTRSLAGELVRYGVRVVGLRPNFTPETSPGVTADDVARLATAPMSARSSCSRGRSA
jgi:NAD(P)-dependent dehydrogenase (short-subunit alcohol dehydrogenase family)